MNMARFLGVTATLVGILALFCWFVWPTPYIYSTYGNGGVGRVNRFTGKLELATEQGWLPPGKAVKSMQASAIEAFWGEPAKGPLH